MIIYWVYKENHPPFLKQAVNVFDLGYLGVGKDFPEQLLSSLPYRKKRKLKISKEERYYNKDHAKIRIVTEHIIICRLKNIGY
jgi:hypothetical protein